ncbi:MAG: sigma-54 dependent transcriptional regulator [Pseudomonadota bacterium]
MEGSAVAHCPEIHDSSGNPRCPGDDFQGLVGSTPAMRDVFSSLARIAATDLSVLVTGETGTGKEVVARALHDASSRKDKPFVVLDCSAIPRDLVESTVFGHEKGSFTGAVGVHRGCFEQANGGTIFLDEVGELDLGLQPKLLRVLEKREIRRVGSDRTIKIDVRVLAATNRDLRKMIGAGSFREDLFFRLAVVLVEVPPLRNRIEDVPSLAATFLADVERQLARRITLAPDALAAMTD